MKRSSHLCLTVAALLLCSCSNSISTNSSKQADLTASDGTSTRTSTSSRDAVALQNARDQQVSVFNAEVETAVANESLVAWRKAIAGDKAGALKMFDDLDRRYPSVLTLKFMRGQVYEHFGDKKEALKYFKMAATGNEFSSMTLFKVAETMRTTGDAAGAVEEYRKLLTHAPKFVPGQVGLAECLWTLDKNSKEAKKLLDEALALEPKNKAALALQSKFKTK